MLLKGGAETWYVSAEKRHLQPGMESFRAGPHFRSRINPSCAVEATNLLRTVIAEVDVAIFAFGHEGALKLVNRAGERLLALLGTRPWRTHRPLGTPS